MDSNIEMFRKVDCQITKDDLIAIKVQQLEEDLHEEKKQLFEQRKELTKKLKDYAYDLQVGCERQARKEFDDMKEQYRGIGDDIEDFGGKIEMKKSKVITLYWIHGDTDSTEFDWIMPPVLEQFRFKPIKRSDWKDIIGRESHLDIGYSFEIFIEAKNCSDYYDSKATIGKKKISTSAEICKEGWHLQLLDLSEKMELLKIKIFENQRRLSDLPRQERKVKAEIAKEMLKRSGDDGSNLLDSIQDVKLLS